MQKAVLCRSRSLLETQMIASTKHKETPILKIKMKLCFTITHHIKWVYERQFALNTSKFHRNRSFSKMSLKHNFSISTEFFVKENSSINNNCCFVLEKYGVIRKYLQSFLGRLNPNHGDP